MARSLAPECTLREAVQCNFPQSKEKQAGLKTRPTRTAVLLCPGAQVWTLVCESEHVWSPEGHFLLSKQKVW